MYLTWYGTCEVLPFYMFIHSWTFPSFTDLPSCVEYFHRTSEKVYKVQGTKRPDWKGCGNEQFSDSFIWTWQLVLFVPLKTAFWLYRPSILCCWLFFAIMLIVKVRTDRSISYFDGDDNPHVARLHDILLTYSFYNFDLGYCQVTYKFSLISAFLFYLSWEKYFQDPENKL